MTAKEILSKLTLEEKIRLCSGVGSWNTYGSEDAGLKSVSMSDGPTGLRKEEMLSNGKKHDLPATCFPTAAALACSWDPQLMYEISSAIATECHAADTNILLAPGVNIKRSPLCGRNFEYISEDPYLAGTMAAGYVNGLQKNGVGASLKHFACNNQEYARLKVSAEVDERALREIYLKPFEIVVKKAKPFTIMSSYNRVNGEYVGESKRLLSDILRDEWGFKGVVESDWLAVNDRVKALKAGCNLEMPDSKGNGSESIRKALESGELTEKELDKNVLPIIELSLKFKDFEITKRPMLEQQNAIAKKGVVESAVLLKNDNSLLPFSENETFAVIGALADKCRWQGGGSSNVTVNETTSFLEALNLHERSYGYTEGYSLSGSGYSKTLIDRAVTLAKRYKQAFVFVGLTEDYESEGSDRTSMRLPYGQQKLLEALCETECRLCVVLMSGSPVELPFKDKVDAILTSYLGGQAVGEGLYDLLFGLANPSGKLAETFPLRLEDNINHQYFPMGPYHVEYRESVYVGYRYYDAAEKTVAYPFGHGLSYTSFEYGDISADKKTLDCKDTLTVKVTVKNTGDKDGKETVQLYVSDRESTVFRPVKELRAYKKISLLPGRKKTVTFKLTHDDFAFYNVNKGALQVESGKFDILIGSSSRDIRQSVTVNVKGDAENIPDYRKSAPGYYTMKYMRSIPKEQFEALCGRKIPENKAQKRGEYDKNSSLFDYRTSWFGKVAGGAIETRYRIQFRGHDRADMLNRIKSTLEYPIIRGVYEMGIIDSEIEKLVLEALNERKIGNFAKIIRKKYKTKK